MNCSTRSYHCLSFLVFFFCCIVFSSGIYSRSPVYPVARQGVLDLRQTDLAHQAVPLNGEWALYWHKLVSPADTGRPSVFTLFPNRWQKTTVNGSLLPSVGYASYTLTVLLPNHRRKLALEIPDTYTSYRLFINDEEFAAAGNPDSNELKAVPKWLHKTLELTIPGDTLHLVLHVANYLHSKGGPYKEILIGDKDALFHKRIVEASLVRGMGVDDIIVKPFVPEHLFKVVLYYTGVYTSFI